MPKTVIRLLVAFPTLCLLINPWAWAASPLSGWSSFKTIKIEGRNRYKTVWLDQDVYRQTNALADLRLVDATGNFVPYYIQNESLLRQTQAQELTGRLTKRFWKKNSTHLDYQILRQSSRIDPVGTGVRFDLPNQNFYKEIQLYGSYDGVSWDPVSSGNIYRVDELVQDRIEWAEPQKYDYYRLVIPNNLESIEPLGFKLVTAELWQRRGFQRNTKLAFQIIPQHRQSCILIKNPNRLNLKRIDLVTAGNYKRGFRVEDNTGNQLLAASDVIYNLQFHNFKIAARGIDLNAPTTASELKLIILNNDDQPLTIKELKADYLIDRIVFEAQNKQPYRVYFGNPQAARVHYDISEYAEHIEAEPLDFCSFTTPQRLGETAAAQKRPGFTLIFNLIIGFVSLVMVVLLVRALRRSEAPPAAK